MRVDCYSRWRTRRARRENWRDSRNLAGNRDCGTREFYLSADTRESAKIMVKRSWALDAAEISGRQKMCWISARFDTFGFFVLFSETFYLGRKIQRYRANPKGIDFPLMSGRSSLNKRILPLGDPQTSVTWVGCRYDSAGLQTIASTLLAARASRALLWTSRQFDRHRRIVIATEGREAHVVVVVGVPSAACVPAL